MSMQRILLIGGVALVKGRIQDAGPIMVEICDEWEPILKESAFIEKAPFKTISLVIRFGSQESAEPVISRIDRRNKELPVSYELPMERLRFADRAEVKKLFARATKRTLEKVAKEYGLPDPAVIGSQE